MDGLKLVIDKLSQYSFLTNILPGTVLCIILKYLIGYDMITGIDWYLLGVIFYFVGMVSNRFGSLVVEYFLKLIRFIKFAPYKDFIISEQMDSKLTTLSMENNVFRSYLSVMTLSLLALLYKSIECRYVWIEEHRALVILMLMVVLFAFSYRKQTMFVKKRVETNLKNTSVTNSKHKV